MGREAILEKLRRGITRAKAHPGIIETEKSDNREQMAGEFREKAIRVGAEVTELRDKKHIESILSEQYSDAIDFRKQENREKYGVRCAKGELEKISTAILESRFGVAENGAIWLDDSCFPNRIIPFIAEQLVVLVPNWNLVSTMHEAYGKISKTGSGFGVFISGPSKTADIEQSLVYGAHGAKRLMVLFYL